MERKRFKWNVVLQAATGETIETTFSAFWSPTKDYVTPESIAKAAAVREFLARNKETEIAPISAALAA